VLIRQLIDGTFYVEPGLGITMTATALLENFQLDSIPTEPIFEAEPRTLKEYQKIRSTK